MVFAVMKGVARAERRAAIGQRPMALRRHKQSAGTACVRLQPAKPARQAICERGHPREHRRPLGGPPGFACVQ